MIQSWQVKLKAPSWKNGPCGKKVIGQLVVLGFAIAGFTPAPYQRRRLQRPLYGVLILRMASHLDAFSAYPNQT